MVASQINLSPVYYSCFAAWITWHKYAFCWKFRLLLFSCKCSDFSERPKFWYQLIKQSILSTLIPLSHPKSILCRQKTRGGLFYDVGFWGTNLASILIFMPWKENQSKVQFQSILYICWTTQKLQSLISKHKQKCVRQTKKSFGVLSS